MSDKTCLTEEEARTKFPVKLELFFRTEDERSFWLSVYSNSGEQQMECYEQQTTKDGTYATEQSYVWPQPTLFIAVDSEYYEKLDDDNEEEEEEDNE